MKTLKKYAMLAFLGLLLAFFGVTILSYQYWFIMLIVFMIQLTDKENVTKQLATQALSWNQN